MEGGCHSAASEGVFLFLLTPDEELEDVVGLLEDDFLDGDIVFLLCSLLTF